MRATARRCDTKTRRRFDVGRLRRPRTAPHLALPDGFPPQPITALPAPGTAQREPPGGPTHSRRRLRRWSASITVEKGQAGGPRRSSHRGDRRHREAQSGRTFGWRIAAAHVRRPRTRRLQCAKPSRRTSSWRYAERSGTPPASSSPSLVDKESQRTSSNGAGTPYGVPNRYSISLPSGYVELRAPPRVTLTES